MDTCQHQGEGAKSVSSALDHCGGAFIGSLFRERSSKSAEEAAKSQVRLKVIEAIGEEALSIIKKNPLVASEAAQDIIGDLIKSKKNVVASLEFAADNLKLLPPSDEEAATGPEEMSADTLNRWKRFAEDADSDQLRERWGRVLAAEVRRPGTFSAKVLRAVDEMDPETAALFESLKPFMIGRAIPKSLRKLSFNEITVLVEAGLLIDPGSGHIRLSKSLTLVTGEEV